MGKIAFVFAGQGAQAVGMGQDLSAHSAAARAVFALSAPHRDIAFSGPKEALDQTQNTQPCLFLMDLACARALQEAGICPDGAAGFSLGEVAAVAFCDLLSDADAFSLVCARARAMQSCAERHSGAMFAVVRLDAAQVQDICATLDGAYAVNFNCPGQTVVACTLDAADGLKDAVRAAGGRALPLAVSGPFHTPLMADAADALAAHIASLHFSAPSVPLYANATAEPYGDPAALLPRQVCSPVLWQATIERMIADGFDTFVEVGPGRVLSGLIEKINAAVRVFSVNDAQTLRDTVAALKE